MLLLLSDILGILGNLSRAFQKITLNLLSVEGCIKNAIQIDPFNAGYLTTLETTLDITVSVKYDQFKSSAQSYISAIIQNLNDRFPQARLLTLLGYLDPKNVDNATPCSLVELGDLLEIDGHRLWQEFTGHLSRICQRSLIQLLMFLLQLSSTKAPVGSSQHGVKFKIVPSLESTGLERQEF